MTSPSPGGRPPTFRPKTSVLEEFLGIVGHLFGLAKGIVHLWSLLGGGSVARRTLAAGAVGLLGTVGLGSLRVSGLAAGPLFLYLLAILAFQVPWIIFALPAVRRDSRRAHLLHRLHRDEENLAERHRLTRHLRHRRAALVAPPAPALEKGARAPRAMRLSAERFEADTGFPLALVLFRRRPGRRRKVVLTMGEVADCLKTGTRLDAQLSVREYVEDHSPYPQFLIEREDLAGTEYHLLAASEIDVLGEGKQAVLDCFVELIDLGLLKAAADRNA